MGEWTTPGIVTWPQDQKVIRNTGRKGSHHYAFVYEMRCEDCGKRYGANGCDVWFRKCPNPACKKGGGAPGEPLG